MFIPAGVFSKGMGLTRVRHGVIEMSNFVGNGRLLHL